MSIYIQLHVIIIFLVGNKFLLSLLFKAARMQKNVFTYFQSL